MATREGYGDHARAVFNAVKTALKRRQAHTLPCPNPIRNLYLAGREARPSWRWSKTPAAGACKTLNEVSQQVILCSTRAPSGGYLVGIGNGFVQQSMNRLSEVGRTIPNSVKGLFHLS